MTDPVACRVTVAWIEGQPMVEDHGLAAHAKAAVAAGREAPAPMRAVAEHDRGWTPDPATTALLRHAREHGLAKVYDPAGVSFAETTPLHIGHEGPEIGRLLRIDPDGDGFRAHGWLHPDHAEAFASLGGVSPLLVAYRAALSADGTLLRVVAAGCVEVSAVAHPARVGTALWVSGLELVPEPDWTALQTPGSAFAPNVAHDARPVRVLRFVTDEAEERFRRRDAERAAADRAYMAALSRGGL